MRDRKDRKVRRQAGTSSNKQCTDELGMEKKVRRKDEKAGWKVGDEERHGNERGSQGQGQTRPGSQ